MGIYSQECSQLSAEGEPTCRHGNLKGVNYFLPQREEYPLQREETPATGSPPLMPCLFLFFFHASLCVFFPQLLFLGRFVADL